MNTTADALQTAWAHHQAGRLREAEQLYRQVLSANPRHAQALHLLGLLALQAGNAAAAVECISQAIRCDGGQPAFHANLGEAFRKLRRTDEALASYRRALQLDPQLAEAHNNLGTLEQARGDLPAALACYRRAIELKPHYPDAHNNLGNALRAGGDWDGALASYGRAAEVAPSYAPAYLNLGLALATLDRSSEARAALSRAIAIQDKYLPARFALASLLQKQKAWAEAEAEYRRILEIEPRAVEAYNGLGTLQQAQGRLDEAIRYYAQAAQMHPQYAEAHYNWGTALVAGGHHQQALEKYERATACNPNMAEAHYNLGTVLQTLERLPDAAAAYQQAIRLRPDYVLAHNNLGNVYHELGNAAAAIACFERALEMDPGSSEALNNLGNALQREGRVRETIACFERALAANPLRAETYNNLASACQLQGDFDRARDLYHKSLELKPDFPEAHHNLGLLLLSQEEFETGWQQYAWRLRCQRVIERDFKQPLWQGEPLAGRTLLIHAEQGLGDTLQMLRYVPLAAERGGRVLLEVQPRLVPLVRGSGFADALAGGDALPPFDVHAPMLSLPGIFRTTLDTIPRNVPYLAADPELVSAWRERLAQLEGLRVGIAWQGSRGYQFDCERSIALEHFAPLAAVAGVRLVGLQKYDGREQLADAMRSFEIEDLGPQLDEDSGAFMDTAAVLGQLDLMITSDSAIAHLAGALGVRTWLALPRVPDWRWFLHREDSPWYPTVRLFRQTRRGAWDEVFQRMARELAKLASTKNS